MELHFVSENIIRTFEDTAGNEIQYKFKKVILKKGTLYFS